MTTQGPSGVKVSDYSLYCEGDTEPSLNKVIRNLVVRDTNFIVYIDQDGMVEWSCNDAYGNLCDGADDVLNRVSQLESVPSKNLTADEGEAFHRMVGEATARAIGSKNIDSAMKAIDQAQRFVTERLESIARMWITQAYLASLSIALISGMALWLYHPQVAQLLGQTSVELGIAGVAGVVGGFLSLISRQSPGLDPSAGRGRHYFDGTIRALGAAFGAILVLLGMRLNLALGIISGSRWTAVLFAGIIAGASERLVPSLVRKFDEVSDEPRTR